MLEVVRIRPEIGSKRECRIPSDLLLLGLGADDYSMSAFVTHFAY